MRFEQPIKRYIQALDGDKFVGSLRDYYDHWEFYPTSKRVPLNTSALRAIANKLDELNKVEGPKWPAFLTDDGG